MMFVPALPFLIALLPAAAVLLLARDVRPWIASLALVCTAAALAIGAASVVLLYLLALLFPLHALALCPSWLCGTVPFDRPVGALVGALVGWRVCAVLRTWWRHHRAVRCGPDSREPLAVIDGDEPVAYARPVGPGQIVVSRGLLGSLDDDERLCLLAHERAHLDARHHHLLLVTDLAAAWFPLLRVLRPMVHYSTERWADEVAARQVGDRRLVARTIAQVALATHAHLPAAGGSAVVRRCEALLASPPHRRWPSAAVLSLAVLAVLAAAGVEVHHLVDVVARLVMA